VTGAGTSGVSRIGLPGSEKPWLKLMMLVLWAIETFEPIVTPP
jgi:hypothetical protein